MLSNSSSSSSLSSDSRRIDLSEPHISMTDIIEILKFGRSQPIFVPSQDKLFHYQRAFVHKSIPEEVKKCNYTTPSYMTESNERMEMVGDALYSAAVTVYLSKVFKNKNEGELSKMRSRIVQGKTMSMVAKDKLNLGKHILVAPSVLDSKKNARFLEDCFEAFVCAIYEDRGFENGVCVFAFNVIRNCIPDEDILTNTNYKDMLMHFSKVFPVVGDVKFISQKLDKDFSVTVELAGNTYGPYRATKKKDAEQLVSKHVVELLEITEEMIDTQRQLKKNALKTKRSTSYGSSNSSG
jgi:ribonuclease-3